MEKTLLQIWHRIRARRAEGRADGKKVTPPTVRRPDYRAW